MIVRQSADLPPVAEVAVKQALADRADAIALGDSAVALRSVWQVVEVLSAHVPGVSGEAGAVSLRLIDRLPPVTTVGDVLAEVKPALRTGWRSYCRDHHSVSLCEPAMFELVAAAPAADAGGEGGSLTALAGRVRTRVEWACGFEWPAELSELLVTAVDVVLSVWPDRASSAPRDPLRWLRGRTTSRSGAWGGRRASRQPVRDELVGRGISPYAAKYLSLLVVGRDSLDRRYGAGVSAAVMAALPGDSVPAPAGWTGEHLVPQEVAAAWARCVLAAITGRPVSQAAADRISRRLAEYRLGALGGAWRLKDSAPAGCVVAGADQDSGCVQLALF